MPPTYSQACTEMSPTLSKLLYTTWFLLIVFLAFVFAPVPGLEASYGSSNRIPSVEEGMAFFDQILEGESLARPFPAMPVRPDNPATTDKIELGRLLFFDPLLSGDNSVSCATCHHPDLGFSDNRMLAMGMGGDGMAEVRVIDTGIGMNEEQVEIALSPFGQGDSGHTREYEGTGLGLPISKAIVELHGGSLEVTSSPGLGTTIMMRLPVEQTARERRQVRKMAN